MKGLDTEPVNMAVYTFRLLQSIDDQKKAHERTVSREVTQDAQRGYEGGHSGDES